MRKIVKAMVELEAKQRKLLAKANDPHTSPQDRLTALRAIQTAQWQFTMIHGGSKGGKRSSHSVRDFILVND